MRLIDADALIEAIQKYKFGAISNESEREYTREIMLCFVNGSSTAYDVEKVVAELEEELEEANIMWDNGEFYKGVANGVFYAIDVVKRGGVE